MTHRTPSIYRFMTASLLLGALVLSPSCATSLNGEVPVTPAATPVLSPIIGAADKTLQTADQLVSDVISGVGNAAKSVVISINNGTQLGHQAAFKSYQFRINERRFRLGLPPTPESRIARRQAEHRFQLGIK